MATLGLSTRPSLKTVEAVCEWFKIQLSGIADEAQKESLTRAMHSHGIDGAKAITLTEKVGPRDGTRYPVLDESGVRASE